MRLRPVLFLLLVPMTGLASCSDEARQSSRRFIDGANPEQGRALIQAYGCGTCHRIDGVKGARGRVGPALDNYAEQHLLAGFLPNTPPYLVAWLVDPTALKTQTGMPAMGVTETEARHMASYLYTLGDEAQVYPPDPPLPLRVREEFPTGIGDPVEQRDDTTPRTHRVIPGQGIVPRS